MIFVCLTGCISKQNNTLQNTNINKNQNTEEKDTNNSSKTVEIPFGVNNHKIGTIKSKADTFISGDAFLLSGEKKRIGTPAITAEKFVNDYSEYFLNFGCTNEMCITVFTLEDFTQKYGSLESVISYYDSTNSITLNKEQTNEVFCYIEEDSISYYRMIYKLNTDGDILVISLYKSVLDENTGLNDASKYLYNLVSLNN